MCLYAAILSFLFRGQGTLGSLCLKRGMSGYINAQSGRSATLGEPRVYIIRGEGLMFGRLTNLEFRCIDFDFFITSGNGVRAVWEECKVLGAGGLEFGFIKGLQKS